jgi:hypothetical protein
MTAAGPARPKEAVSRMNRNARLSAGRWTPRDKRQMSGNLYGAFGSGSA